MQRCRFEYAGGTGPPTGQSSRPGIPRAFPNTFGNGNAAGGSGYMSGNSNGFGNNSSFVTGREASQRNCTNCGQSGHYNMDCPRNQQGRVSNRNQDRRRNDPSVPPASGWPTVPFAAWKFSSKLCDVLF